MKRIKANVRWVSRSKAKVRCPSGAGLRSDGIAPLNGFAREGEPWTGKRNGAAKIREQARSYEILSKPRIVGAALAANIPERMASKYQPFR